MTLSKTLIPLLFLLVLANKVVSQTTQFTYNFFSQDSENLDYQGDAFVPPDSPFLRLTKVDGLGVPAENSVGRALYIPPVIFEEAGTAASFHTAIRFSITPVDEDPADGIAFFIIPVDSPIPPSSWGGSFGIFNSSGLASSVFAVEFDLYQNTFDPSYPHIGIDINSVVSKTVSKFEDALNKVVTAHITYDAPTRTIDVAAYYGSQVSRVIYNCDLMNILPPRVQVGISASTGTHVALHDIISWSFTSTLNAVERSKIDNNIQQYV